MLEEPDSSSKISVPSWLALILLGFVLSAIVTALANHVRGRTADASLDAKLQKVITLYDIRPLSIRRYEADPKWKLGQALFLTRS